jgi:hypothetical protein
VTLDEAYAKLGLEDSLDWCRATTPEGRGLGTTTRTALELYLDMRVAQAQAAARGSHPPQFLFIVPTVAMGQHFRRAIQDMHVVLEGAVDMKRLTIHIPDGRSVQLRGNTWYSWAVFCDHSIKGEVIPWPSNRVRSLEEDGDLWVGKDRDGNVVLHLTEDGKTNFLRNSTCPVSVVPSWLEAPACYPAWSDVTLMVKLNEAFKV